MSTREDSDVQRAVRNHWANTKSSEEPSIASSTNERKIAKIKGKTPPPIIDLDLETTSDESDEEVLEITRNGEFKKIKYDDVLSTPMFGSSKLQTPSPVHVFNTPSLKPPNALSITSFFNSKLLKETFIFSFELDVQFIADAIHNISNTKVTIIAQNLYNEKDFPFFQYVNVHDITGKWACHHSKLVINFYKDDTMQVFVSTSNFTPAEYASLGGVFWKSDLLFFSDSNTSTKQEFKIDLCNYLLEYRKEPISNSIEKIKLFDFSSVKASFVGSTPGVSTGKFGYLRLHQHLSSRGLFPDYKQSNKFKLLAQTSTIGGPFSFKQGNLANILTHLLLPLVMNEPFPLEPGESSLNKLLRNEKFEVDPMFLFPTLDEVISCEGGYITAGPLIYNNKSKNGIMQDKMISKYFFKRNEDEVGNLNVKFHPNGTVIVDKDVVKPFVNNHSKIYLFTEDDFKTLNWCFIGSMNLSKAAWGAPSRQLLRGTNWECGVLLDPKDYNSLGKFMPVFNENVSHLRETAIRLPFKLPVQKYRKDDEAWCRFDPIGAKS